MKCIEAEKNLDAFFDGEIAKSKEIETHLKNCVSCQTNFENLSVMRRTLKQNLAVSAPPLLGEKVFIQFRNHHENKQSEIVETNQPKAKFGWFGIPRFAWATALILFTLATISAFQIGKMSASEIVVSMPQVQENATLTNAKDDSIESEKSVQIKYVEVPIVREKIIEVPIIKEKIVTRTIYVNKNEKTDMNLPGKEDFALKNKIEANKYLTRSNLEGFQPVSEMNLRISKEVNQNEK